MKASRHNCYQIEARINKNLWVPISIDKNEVLWHLSGKTGDVVNDGFYTYHTGVNTLMNMEIKKPTFTFRLRDVSDEVYFKNLLSE